jgi:type IV fimbrial biogenesis protein FimT
MNHESIFESEVTRPLPYLENGSRRLQRGCLQRQSYFILGYTVVELMVVLAIAAILAVMAGPSFSSMLNNIRQKSAANLIASDLNFARGEAVKRNARVLMCAKNAAGTDCATASKNWASGWVVCVDTTDDGADNCDATTAVSPNPLQVRAALNNQLTLTANDGTNSIYFVRFNANSTQGAGTTPLTLTLAGTWSGAVSKVVSIAVTGNVKFN